MTVPYMACETPTSLVSRLAARNGIPLAGSFCEDQGMLFRQVIDGEPAAIQRLAELAGVDPNRLFASTFRKIDENVRLLGAERFDRQWMSRARLRVCPACLLQDAEGSTLPPDAAMYCRTWWQISFIRTCHLHSTPLAILPSERRTVHDFAASVRPHASDLSRLVETTAPVETTRLEDYLLRRIVGDGGGIPLLDGLATGVAARFCEVLGTVGLHGCSQRSSKLDESQLRIAAQFGCDMATAGEDAIRTFILGLVRGDVTRSANGGPQAALGSLHAWFSDNRDTQDMERLRGLVRDAVAASLPIGSGKVCLGQSVNERQVHSIRSASRETGVHPKRLRKLLREAGFIGDEHADLADNLVMFSAEASAPFLAELCGTKGLTKVSAYINAPRVQAQLLFHAGFLRPVYPNGGSTKRLLAFNVKEVDALMLSLLDGAEVLDREVEGAFSIPRAAKRVPCGAMDIVSLIQNRRLPWVGRRSDELGYMSIRVRPDQVRPALFPGVGISVDQAARKLKLHYVLARKIIRLGLINEIPGRCPEYYHERYNVRSESVDDFIKNYIALSEIQIASATKGNSVKSILRSNQIYPVTSSYDVGKVYYKRDEVEALPNLKFR
ncbi:TniQ family protein [Methylobacterium sp. SI9]|uniref:TniQ family protein n=1 Tax=Methylobacterium guangdongense TaxID=3138811 RepID=UPI00313C400F